MYLSADLCPYFLFLSLSPAVAGEIVPEYWLLSLFLASMTNALWPVSLLRGRWNDVFAFLWISGLRDAGSFPPPDT